MCMTHSFLHFFFFSSRRRHTRYWRDWSSDVCSSDLVYGAVSPIEGELDWKISPQMNTEQMNQFLAQVSQAHPDEFIVMVVDGASSHRSQELRIPENIRWHRLPGYSP